MQEDFSAQLERQKLEAMKELAYGASHEINNPLANIAARAQTLLRDETAPERRSSLEAIHQQAMRAHEMISDLMLFARPPQLNLESVDLVELVRTIAGDLEAELQRRSIRLDLHLPATACLIRADKQQLAVAVRALCDNSANAIGSTGTIEISLGPGGADDSASIEVSDTGSGISAEVREHLFDPFYSGREAGRGLGFGLSKCWRIVTDHGGSIVVDDTRGVGAGITILLPTDCGQHVDELS
jgi:signal transduction histidine kinase